eukprot:TRINITY_DN11494_c0_g1_i1.p1 TRINITY_DN11494_c0_g1~~TRINITY_DN11494_c0_g1_i1.p1  ORF type:complete len:624 (+),score=68.46 TRINITY_DN11494_c0_g1_i1:128-1999(+)
MSGGDSGSGGNGALGRKVCASRAAMDWCLSAPSTMTRECPSSCDSGSVESKIRRRVLMESVIDDRLCSDLLSLVWAGALSADAERAGLNSTTLLRAVHWAGAQMPGEARVTALLQAQSLLAAARALDLAAERALASVANTTLHAGRAQLVCRRSDAAAPVLRFLDDGGDNGGHHYVARLFLNSFPEGGDFVYTDSWDDPLDQRARVQPACGRAVAFFAGSGNWNGMEQVVHGEQCVFSLSYVDERRAKSSNEFKVVEELLQSTPAHPSAIVDQYYDLCASSSNQDGSPALETVQQHVLGKQMTFQVLSRSPQLTKISGFLSKEEISHIVELGSRRLKPSTVFEKGVVKPMHYRTSETSWISEKSAHNSTVIQNLMRRIEYVTGLSLESAEDLQLAFYDSRSRGKYESHFDWGLLGKVNRNFNHKDPPPGARIATLLMYLSDAKQGGHTVFSDLNISVRPELGSALFFFNLLTPGDRTLDGDPKLTHGACPCVEDKFVLTKWIHERGQERIGEILQTEHSGRFFRNWANLTTMLAHEPISVAAGDDTEPDVDIGDATCGNTAAIFTSPDGDKWTCEDYASFGYCKHTSEYRDFMLENCRKTCGFCRKTRSQKRCRAGMHVSTIE